MTEDNKITKAADVYQTFMVSGSLHDLSPEEKAAYVTKLCETLGLNPMTRPFRWIKDDSGKMILYATKECSEQLRNVNNISLRIVERQLLDNGVYVVTARAVRQDGREDESTGAVFVSGKKGDSLANLIMKAETKAKRRVTLSICGLGFMSEDEAKTVGVEVSEDGPKLLTPRYPEKHEESSTVKGAFDVAKPPVEVVKEDVPETPKAIPKPSIKKARAVPRAK